MELCDTGYFDCGAMSMQMSFLSSLCLRGLRDRKNGVQEYAKRPELFTFSACNSCIMRHFYQSDDCINYLVNISVVKNSGHEKRVISSHA